jgi:hypothetical protein
VYVTQCSLTLELFFAILCFEIYTRYKIININLNVINIMSLKRLERLRKCFCELSDAQFIINENFKFFLLLDLFKLFTKTLTSIIFVVSLFQNGNDFYEVIIVFAILTIENVTRLAIITSCGLIAEQVRLCNIF